MEKKGTFINWRQVVAIVFLITLSYPSVAQEISGRYVLASEVMLKGTLLFEKKFGPPNYGENPETDKVEIITVLKLPAPITIYRDKKAMKVYMENQSFIHLGIAKNIRTFELMNDICVQVYGEIYEAYTGHHHYPTVMAVKKIEEC